MIGKHGTGDSRRFFLFCVYTVPVSLLETLIVFFGILNLTFGIFLYANSKQSVVVRLYALIIIFATLWSLATLFTTPGLLNFRFFELALWGHYVFGYLAYLSFFWFAILFPNPPQRRFLVLAGALTACTLLYLLVVPTHFFFLGIYPGATLGASVTFNEPGYMIFILMLSGVFFACLLILLRTRRMVDKTILYKDLDPYQINFAILANFVAGVLGIVFNLIYPLYGNFNYFYINPILVTAALITIGLYNVLRYNLFNSRIILSEFFTGGILILSLTRFILSPSGTERILDGILLAVMTGFSFFLIQSIFREIALRDQLEKQEKELQQANSQQENLLNFISHEIKGYLTKSEAAFASIVEGDYGIVPDALKGMSTAALEDVRKGVTTVMDILDASNLKKGTVSFKKAAFDFKAVVLKVLEEQRPAAYEKHLGLDAKIPDGNFKMQGDEEKIKEHVIRNLIDNAIKYTPSGTVHIELSGGGGKIRFSVQDSGVGITPEDMAHLFTEGGHGKDSIKINVHSTGYGLFIAKEITDAHQGKIWAESDGQGKGSRFVVEFPAA